MKQNGTSQIPKLLFGFWPQFSGFSSILHLLWACNGDKIWTLIFSVFTAEVWPCYVLGNHHTEASQSVFVKLKITDAKYWAIRASNWRAFTLCYKHHWRKKELMKTFSVTETMSNHSILDKYRWRKDTRVMLCHKWICTLDCTGRKMCLSS